MTPSCAASGCNEPPAVRLKTVPLCDVHAHLVLATAGSSGTRVTGLVTHQVEAMLSTPATTATVAEAAALP